MTDVLTWFLVLPLAGSPIVYLIGRIVSRRGPIPLQPAQPIASVSRWVALVFFAVEWIPFSFLASAIAHGGQDISLLTWPGTSATTFTPVHLRFDGLSLLLAGVALLLGTLVCVFSAPYMSREFGQEKYYAMLLAMVGAMIGLGSAADLFNLWLWFELMAVTSYLLVAFYRGHPASLEAGVKYLVQSALGSVMVLLGIALVLGQSGTLDLESLRMAGAISPSALAAGGLFIIGFGVKAALVPLHTWLPDAHAQAPSGISAMLSGIVIEAGLIALLRVVTALTAAHLSWGVILLTFGAVNMLVGNLMALRQKQVKRLLAYSSLSHVGYMLLGLGVGVYLGDLASAQGGFFHLLNHGMMKGLAFLSAGVLLYCLHIAVGDHGPLEVSDLSGAARRYPLAALAMSLAVLGLGGLPPLAGFMSKWQIFVAGFSTHRPFIEALIVFAALNSVLSLAYYAPLVNALYRGEPSPIIAEGSPMPRLMAVPLGALSLAIVAVGVWPGLANWITMPAGQALIRGLLVAAH
jgi:proton-translocating NADH-quinone oxidoreductase chain N